MTQEQLGNVALQVANIVAVAVAVLAALVFLGFLAFYVLTGAALPRILQRVSPKLRLRASRVLAPIASTLRGWILGRLVSMAVVGGLTVLGLFLLEIPYAVTLGLIAAMLGLVPSIGPIIAVVPAAALAFTVGPAHVLYVLGLYLGISLVDGLLLTPWIEKRTVGVPPTVAIVGQLVAGVVAGLPGVIIATPILALLLVIVRRFRLKNDSAPSLPVIKIPPSA